MPAGTIKEPNLFLSASRREALRKLIERPGTHHYQAYLVVKRRVDRSACRNTRERPG